MRTRIRVAASDLRIGDIIAMMDGPVREIAAIEPSPSGRFAHYTDERIVPGYYGPGGYVNIWRKKDIRDRFPQSIAASSRALANRIGTEQEVAA